MTILSISRPKYCMATVMREQWAGHSEWRTPFWFGNFACAPFMLNLRLHTGVIMKTKITSIDSGIRRRKATLQAKLEDLSSSPETAKASRSNRQRTRSIKSGRVPIVTWRSKR